MLNDSRRYLAIFKHMYRTGNARPYLEIEAGNSAKIKRLLCIRNAWSYLAIADVIIVVSKSTVRIGNVRLSFMTQMVKA